jgi:hypothetical protein
MKNTWLFIALIAVMAGLLFFVSNHFMRGYLRSEITLAKEIKSPPVAIYRYTLSQEPPFRYRVVFPAIVKSIHTTFYTADDSRGFYVVYVGVSLIFYITSAVAMFWLLKQCGFDNILCFSGCIIYLLLPAMLLAFTLPVHTREDTLAYTLFFTGLGLLIRRDRWVFLCVSIAGALTRETLLLLPLLYLLFAKDERIFRRLFIAGVPVLAWLFVRFGLPQERYDVWEGLTWNLNNLEQVAGFTFIAFNVLWLPFVLHISFYRRHLHYTPQDLRFFYRTSLFTLLVILLTTFLGGIFNEIRLLFLFSPWMIILALDFWKNYREIIKSVFQTRTFRVVFMVCAVFCATLMFVVLQNREKLIPSGKYSVPYDLWVTLSIVYIFVFLTMIPPSYKVFFLKRRVK